MDDLLYYDYKLFITGDPLNIRDIVIWLVSVLAFVALSGAYLVYTQAPVCGV